MGCDIHLRLEKRLKKDLIYFETLNDIDDDGNVSKIKRPYYTDKHREWRNCGILGYEGHWGDRCYNMFAYLNNVRNYYEDGTIKPLENRGFPEDVCETTLEEYTYTEWNGTDECPEDWGRYVEKETFERWVNEYKCRVYELKDCNGNLWKRLVKDPGAHSPNWCTTEEMEWCIDRVFKDEDGTYMAGSEEWLALLGAMKGYELSGQYECRAVFWFDN